MATAQLSMGLKAIIVSLGTVLAVSDAGAVSPETGPLALDGSTYLAGLHMEASETLLLYTQFMGGRRTNYSRPGRYKGSRTRFSRKRLPRGAASTFGPSKFSHGEKFIGGQGVRITKFDNGFHGGRKIRQRIR